MNMPNPTQLHADNLRLQDELEVERLRLAACGVAALGYFEGCKPEFRSGSLEDVLRLYKDCESLKRQVASLKRQNAELMLTDRRRGKVIARLRRKLLPLFDDLTEKN